MDRLRTTTLRTEARYRTELGRREAEIARLAAELANATSRTSGLEQRLAELERPVQQRLLAGPSLTIVEPALERTRDIVPVARATGPARPVVGRVIAPAGLVALTVNDAPVATNELGVFTVSLPAPAADLPVHVAAVDRQGKRSEVRFVLRNAATARAAGAGPAESTGARAAFAPGVDFGS